MLESELGLGFALGFGVGLGLGLSSGLGWSGGESSLRLGGVGGSVPVATPDSVHSTCIELQFSLAT